MGSIKKTLEWVIKNDLYPDIKTIEGASTDPEVVIEGEKFLMFCSSNYLGMANDKRVKERIIEAVNKYGMGSGGSRLISGNLDIQNELERSIAEFKNTEVAITFLAGYMANVGVIPALMKLIDISFLAGIKKIFKKSNESINSVIFSDELNHASIIDGCRLAKVEKAIYKHKDMNDLEDKIKKYKRENNLIVTDGVFSMDGDIAPLPDIVALGKKYNVMVMVDDAHASGVLGKNGRGTAEYFNLKDGIDVMMGTFSKAFGGIGGFIAGNKDLIDYLRVTARTYIFSAPIPPAIAAGLVESIKIVSSDNARREKLWENIKYIRSKLEQLGFNILGETNIIPLVVGEEKKAISFSRDLLSKNIFLPCVRWPAVPEKQARLRITVMATHTKEHIDQLLNALEITGKKISII